MSRARAARIHDHAIDLERANQELESASAEQIVSWAADRFGDGLVLSTSFGIQSAAMLGLATAVAPDIPVIWVDTGYLPPETYRFAELLTRRLSLNLHVVQAEMSPARMEALHGRLWESEDLGDLNRYDRLRKVEPMKRALDSLGATAWLSGLRAEQTDYRQTLETVGRQDGRAKILPILGWTSRDVHAFLERRELPYHPLFEKGFTTVGDWHSSRAGSADDAHERVTRYRGRKQECGLHIPENLGTRASLDASRL